MEEDYGYWSSDDDCPHNSVHDYEIDGIEDDSELLATYREPASCKVIRKESLLAAQKEDLARVMDLLPINETRARTLLRHYYWNVDKVLDVLVERGEDKLYAEAGIPIANLSSSHFTTVVKCEICFEEFPPEETTAVDCGHSFCNDCWTEYFMVKINEGQSRRITCMTHKCNAICDEGKIRSLVSLRDPKLAAKFDHFLLESYIEDNKRVKWCPSVPHCGNAIRIEKDKYCEVECACGQQFCFNCLYEVHSPCSCSMWELWKRKCSGESANIDWITVHTKSCPKCHKPVEKNGGCNVVRCICKQYFCWLCGDARGYNDHGCGRYKEQDSLERRTDGKDDLARKEPRRFMHYYNRHKAHTDSLKAEAKLKKKLQLKIATLEERELASRDYSWVPNGFHRLTRSRQILSNSYPFAYYMFGNEMFSGDMSKKQKTIKQNLFENQQQQLERNIERLSMILEEPFAEYDDSRLTATKMKIIRLAKVTDDLCKKLYDCIQNELFGSILSAIHIIAPYQSKGVEKASELPDTYLTKTEFDRENSYQSGAELEKMKDNERKRKRSKKKEKGVGTL